MSRRALVASVVAAVLAVGTVVAPSAVAPSTVAAEAASSKVSARTLLRQLPVRSESNSGYQRSKFKHWVDTGDADRCHARNEVLLAEAVKKPRVKKSTCTISGGRWVSKYDGKATTNKSTFDVDHLVPLAEAWGSGAKRWSTSTRTAFANDLGYYGSLIAVSASSNRTKGARDVAQWLPSKKAYRCTYVKQWVAVKWRWGLSVDSAEKRAISRELDRCSTAVLTKPAKAKISVASSSSSTSTTKKTSTSSEPWNRPGPDLDCSDIRKRVRVSAADYHRLDADGDGWGCDSYA